MVSQSETFLPFSVPSFLLIGRHLDDETLVLIRMDDRQVVIFGMIADDKSEVCQLELVGTRNDAEGYDPEIMLTNDRGNLGNTWYGSSDIVPKHHPGATKQQGTAKAIEG